MGRIFLVRHGETTANRDQVIQGPRIDAELSELGRLQAHGVADVLSREPLQAIYTSPLVRARQTASALSRRENGLAVQVVPELYEMDYGDLAGRRYDDVHDTMEQVFDAWRLGFVDQP